MNKLEKAYARAQRRRLTRRQRVRRWRRQGGTDGFLMRLYGSRIEGFARLFA